jgi:hypothetical protein
MIWLSVNPESEKFETINAALALSGKFRSPLAIEDDLITSAAPPDFDEIDPVELADFYNNADALGLDIYR